MFTRVRGALVGCSLLATSACGSTETCEFVDAPAQLSMRTGESAQLAYRTDPEGDWATAELHVRCPTAAEGAVSLSNEGAICSSDEREHSSTSVVWSLQKDGEEYVLDVFARQAGTYSIVAELRYVTDLASRFDEPSCVVRTSVDVKD